MSPQSTNLNIDPYFQDYNPNKKYYQHIFKPSVSVQARELNGIQAQLQNQIEQFADNIFSNGTIVSGCNFQFINPYPYAQINDLDIFNNVVVPQQLLGLNLLNQATGMGATVLNYANGFTTTPPNLKTLYIKYNNTGTANQTTFSPGDVLTAFDPVLNPVYSVDIINGGISFSNTDKVIAASQIICTVTAGTPTVGAFISNGNGLTNVEIKSVDLTTLASSNQAIVQFAPRSVDLANSLANSQFWSFAVSDTLSDPGANFSMTVNQIIGSGMQANIVTNGVGTLINVRMITGGIGYLYPPWMTVQSFNNSTGLTTLNLAAKNYLTQVVVASGANTIGNGYAFAITQGIIYQKGYMLQVDPQQILISKYNQNPDNVAVGFITNESIIDYTIDSSLLSNARGYRNDQAPGADRLQLVPQLITLTTDQVTGNSSFFPLIQWKAGLPYQQHQQTIYSTIGSEMAQRTEDVSGDFVLDPFVATTRSPLTTNQMGQYFNIVVDPGTAYINGFKVQTVANFNLNDRNGTDTAIVNNHTISLNYGNYLVINNVAGVFPFNTGTTVNLFNTIKNYYSSITNPEPNLDPVGTQIGTANMRSMKLLQGQPGWGSSQYALYLFNVKMSAGYNFADVKSVSYNNGAANTGIADVVLNQVPTGNTSANVAQLQEVENDQLVFYSGVGSLKNANNIIYSYRTSNTSLTVANGNISNGTITIDISSGPDTFPYGAGALSQSQLQDFIVTPTGGDMVYTTAVSGTVACNTSSNTANGTSTHFSANLVVGDFVYVTANASGGHDLKQITAIANDTVIQFNSPPAFTNAVATLVRAFPNNVPIPFGYRTRLTGNVNSSENIVTLQFGQPFSFSGTTQATVIYNAEVSSSPTQSNKTANRNTYVMFCTSNNAGGQTGPWCLGVPDAFRLRGVWVGNSTVNTTSTNYLRNFYIDSKQNADFYGLSTLNLNPDATVTFTANTYILCQFDYFSSSGAGFYDTVSYTHSSDANTIYTQDSLPLANLTTFTNSFEVPELFTDDGTEIDLLGYFDFRPYVAATVTPSSTVGGAPMNPSNSAVLSTSGEKKFPVPGSNFIATVEGWLGRIDTLSVDQNGTFSISSGKAVANLALAQPPHQPVGAMKLCDIVIPPYPNLPHVLGTDISSILNTGMITNQKFAIARMKNHTIYNRAANSALPYPQPQRYTQYDIGQLDRRIQQVEYYVVLNTLESNTLSMLIPSSVDGSQNRQAYGVFTDDFTSSAFSALTDPQYAAIKQGPNIVPTKMRWDLSMFGFGTTPYIEYPIIQQDSATIGSVQDPLGLGPICALNLANTVAYQLLYRNATDLELSNPSANTDVVTVQMADQATVFDTIQYVTTPLTQYLQNTNLNQYTLNLSFDSQQIQTVGGNTVIITQEWGPHGANTQYISSLISKVGTAFGSFYYDATTQTLLIEVSTSATHSIVEAFTGIPQQDATLFTEAFLGKIPWSQFFASLNVSGTAPSGGQVAAQYYYPPVSFYFYNYLQPVRYDIYQGTTLIASTDPAASVATSQNLTAAEIALLTSSGADFWFNDNPSMFMQNFQNAAGGGAIYAGKLTFNYNPQNGNIFTIKSTMSPLSDRWRWVLAYPINGAAACCVPPNPIVQVQEQITATTTNITFNAYCGNGWSSSGTATIITGYTATWNPPTITPTTSIVPFDISADWPLTASTCGCSDTISPQPSPTSSGSNTVTSSANTPLPVPSVPQTKYLPVEVHCSNLIPNTHYDVFVNDNNVDALVRQYGNRLGAPLTSDKFGKLRFQYMLAMPYHKAYLVKPNPSRTGLVQEPLIITVQDPWGHVSSQILPLLFYSPVPTVGPTVGSQNNPNK